MIAIIDSLSAARHYDSENLNIELLWIQIFSGSTSLLFGVSYRLHHVLIMCVTLQVPFN